MKTKSLGLRNLIIMDIVATLIATLLVGLSKGFNIALLTLFLGFLVAMALTRFFLPSRGYKRLQERQLERMSKFKERLATEGVIDETRDIAKAGRIVWFLSDQKRSEMLANQVKDFAEVKRSSGKTYAIDRQTLDTLLAKLPVKNQDINELTPSQQKVLTVLLNTGNVTFEEKENKYTKAAC